MSSQLETIISAYKTLSKIPSIISGRLTSNGHRVASKWSVRNLDKGKTTKYNLEYFLDDNLKVVGQTGFGIDVSNELLSSISPLETYRAVIREEKDKKDAKKQYLEVWSKNNLEHSIDLTALDIHGDVYADSEFGGLNWSADESSLVYVAERKLPKLEPYIKRKNEGKTDGSGEPKDAPKKGEEFLYRQDWGEQLVGKYLSSIVLCELKTERVTVLEGLPESWCPGQVRFAPDGKSVVGVAWETEPRRLGLIFCTNRPSVIFRLTLDGTMSKLSDEGNSVRSPRYNANGDLFWLQRTSGGPHHACHELKRRGESGISTVIPIVDTDIKLTNNQLFHGLYCLALPSRCFTSDGRILFSTPQKNEIRTYVVNADGTGLSDISNHSGLRSTSLLDVRGDTLLAVCSDLTSAHMLFIAKLPAPGQEGDIKWLPVSEANAVPDSVTSAKVEYLELEHKDSTDDVKSFTAIYISPVSDKPLPLVVWPHGGPHSGFVNAFSIEAAMHSMLGLASVRINYRGSVGHGEKLLRNLLGKCGTIDIDDCMLTLSSLEKTIDDSRVFLYGGSYGGFINAHLAGRFPDRFKAVVLRNPLIDLATKGHYADNSDGCAVEAGFEFKESGPVSDEELLAMRRCSPLAHVHKVKAPTALMLGSGDKRVPHYQGLEYARRLKANGVATRVYMYDDNHSLSSPAAEMDNIINGMHWFMQHFD